MNLFQFFTLLIPIAAAIGVGVITYFYAIKSKKFDLLYASKIPAFKEIAAKLTDFRSSCLGRVAEYSGTDFSPYSCTGSALTHRTDIVIAVDANIIFLSRSSRQEIMKLLNKMGVLCNLELRLAANPDDIKDYREIYQQFGDDTEKLIELLYNELNLK